MLGDRFSSSTTCSRWRHETEPGRLDQSLSCRFWKVATHPSATVQLPRQMSFYTAYTFNDSAYVGSGDPLVDANQGIVAGTDVTGVPDQLWVVSLDRSGPLGTGLTAKYTSSRRVSLTADWYADDYWLVDAYVSFSGEAVSERLRSTEFSIVANNLLDTAYLSAITENAAWLGAPRTISMTATVSF